MTQGTIERIPTIETGKMLRRVLRDVFPSTRFSVRKNSMCSVLIQWSDGPSVEIVQQLVGLFAGDDPILMALPEGGLPEEHHFECSLIHLDRHLSTASLDFYAWRVTEALSRQGFPPDPWSNMHLYDLTVDGYRLRHCSGFWDAVEALAQWMPAPQLS